MAALISSVAKIMVDYKGHCFQCSEFGWFVFLKLKNCFALGMLTICTLSARQILLVSTHNTQRLFRSVCNLSFGSLRQNSPIGSPQCSCGGGGGELMIFIALACCDQLCTFSPNLLCCHMLDCSSLWYCVVRFP